MGNAVNVKNDSVLGPNGDKVTSLAEKVSNIPWFKGDSTALDKQQMEKILFDFTGALGLGSYQIGWMQEAELSPFLSKMNIADSPLWSKLYPIPDRIKEAAEQSGRTNALAFAADDVPEKVFHKAFEGAFNRFQSNGDIVVKYAVGTAMYVSGLAVAWEIVSDLDGFGANPFLSVLEMFERGCWPIGLFDNQFYVL